MIYLSGMFSRCINHDCGNKDRCLRYLQYLEDVKKEDTHTKNFVYICPEGHEIPICDDFIGVKDDG